MKLTSLDQSNYQINALSFEIIKVAGSDATRFLNGHTTIDVEKLEVGQAKLSSKTDRSGRLLFSFYILAEEKSFFIMCKKESIEALVNEFDKFIIMDDVQLSHDQNDIHIIVGAFADVSYKNTKNRFETNLLSYPAIILLGKNQVTEKEIDESLLKELVFKTDSMFLNSEIPRNKIINSTLYINSVDMNKGCYLGQETIKKIANNRGAATFPCAIEFPPNTILVDQKRTSFLIKEKEYSKYQHFKDQEHDYLIIDLPRELRVDQSQITIIGDREFNGIIKLLPLIKNKTSKEIAQNIYIQAVQEFQLGHEEEAERLFRLGLKVDPSNADLCESLGVLLGRNNKFQDAIDLMDELLKINNDSVMAHTNKSLYLMKLGKIEEAEEEKALATVSSFKALGKEASLKNEKEREALKEMEDLKRKEEMFKQVLEIDSVDIIANFGLGEISFKRKEYKIAEGFLSTALKVDPSHSRAYLVLGKVYEALKEFSKAIETYESGIKIASKKGEMMPANEMQSRLVSVQSII
jgi:tetratricopeptide (TPR) repeat protein